MTLDVPIRHKQTLWIRATMSFTDLFFPDNPKRRKQVIVLSTKLRTYIEEAFFASNDVADLLNTYLTPIPNLEHHYADDNASIEVNSAVLTAVLENIQAVLTNGDEQLKASVDPGVYAVLTSEEISFTQKIETAKTAIGSTVSAEAAVGVLTAVRISKIALAAFAAYLKVQKLAVASIVLGVLAFGLDFIVSAILGAVEKAKLVEAIDELQEAVDVLEPATKDFSRAVIKAQIGIEIYGRS